MFLGIIVPSSPATAQTAQLAPAQLQTQPPRPWTPLSAVLLSQLAPETKFGNFSMRPPAGYKKVEQNSPDGQGKIYYWSGDRHPNGAQPSIAVINAIPPKGQEHAMTPEQLLLNLVESFRGSKTNWVISPIDHGVINGQTFGHATWTATDTKGVTSHGSDYATQLPDGSFILIAAEDTLPYSQSSTPILDAAAQTFKRK